jgi:hypothetical protein
LGQETFHNKGEKEEMTQSDVRKAAEKYYKERNPNSMSFDSEVIFAFEAGVEWIINKENGRR